MKICTKCKLQFDDLFFYKNKNTKDGLSFWCKTCCKKIAHEYYKKNKKGVIEKSRLWRQKNPEKNAKRMRRWRIDNPMLDKKIAKKWRKENKKQIALYMRHKSAERRLQIKKQTPAWADLKKIKYIYNNCPTGMTVDHLIPINGKIVCGLHIHTNLMYLPKSVNGRKGCKFPWNCLEK